MVVRRYRTTASRLARLAALAVLAVAAGGEAGGDGALRVEAVPHGSPPPEAVEVVARATRGEARETVRTGSGPARAVLEAPGEGVVRLEAAAPGWWSPGAVAVLPAQPAVTLELWRTGRIEGAVSVPGERAEDLRLTARLTSPPDAPEGQPSLDEEEFPCEVRTGGRFACEVPAGTWDLALRARGHVSRFFWGRRVPASRALDLGALRFVRGASVVAWVTTADGGDLAGVRARLIPFTASELPGAERGRLTRTGPVVHADRRGFLHFRGVRPGRYVLRAEAPGYAAAETPAFDVQESAETEIRTPLVLEPPATLRVEVDPPTDPWERPWTVGLERRDPAQFGRMRPAAGGEASPAGEWRGEGLAPGEYLLEVLDEEGSVWAAREATLDPGDNQIMVTLDAVDVCGAVVLGEDPVAARVVFREARPEGLAGAAVAVQLESDAEGRLRGALPHPGRWLARVRAPEVHVDSEVGPLEVKAGDGCAEVEIALPARRISGTVVDESGAGAAGATVAVVGEGERPRVVREGAEDDGTFVLRGVGPGRYRLTASDGVRSAEAVEVTVSPDHDPPPVRLVLRSTRHLSGTVTGPVGPVGGARVFAVAPGTLVVPSTVTTPDGAFALDVREPAGSAVLVVAAPGHCLWFGRVSEVLVAENTVAVRVLSECGDVVVRGAGESWAGAALVGERGAFLSLGFFQVWDPMRGRPFLEGDGVNLAGLIPGSYRICGGFAPSSGGAPAGVPEGAPCTDLFVVAGATVTAELPGG